MVDNKNNWQAGAKVFLDISGWIVGPIILALFAGRALDNHYGTKPVMFLVLVGIGFLVTIFGIVRVVKKYQKKISKN